MARKETLGTDNKGVYRRYIGWKPGNGKMIQHLFRLGRDEAAAKVANIRLEQLWEAVDARWVNDQTEGKTDQSCPMWDDITLSIGNAIAKGQTVCTLTPPAGVEGLSPSALATWIAVLQKWFPMIGLKLPGDMLEEGISRLKQQDQLDRKITQTILNVLGSTTAQPLHDALDAYSAYIGEKYEDKPSNRPQQLSISLLRKHTENFTLDKLDADRIETWLPYWCRRPVGHAGEPLAFTTCRNVLIVLRQFLRWLNRSPQFEWRLPDAFAFPRCKIAKTPADRVKRRSYFKLTELKTIWQYAHPWDRALILLALNCGFSKREIATLQEGEIVERKGHTFVKRYRTKTEVYAEWLLWPETLAALAYLKQYRPGGTPYVVVNSAGTPLVKGTKKGNENQVIKNHWDHIFKRIHKDNPAFCKLPFKHLRKTGATYVRHLHIPNAAEIASMYLAHGEKADSMDQLLPVYTHRPWRKLHKALLKLRKKLLPVIASVEKLWASKVFRTSPATLAKIKELRGQGKTLQQISKEVGLHWVTVGKICRQKNDE